MSSLLHQHYSLPYASSALASVSIANDAYTANVPLAFLTILLDLSFSLTLCAIPPRYHHQFPPSATTPSLSHPPVDHRLFIQSRHSFFLFLIALSFSFLRHLPSALSISLSRSLSALFSLSPIWLFKSSYFSVSFYHTDPRKRTARWSFVPFAHTRPR